MLDIASLDFFNGYWVAGLMIRSYSVIAVGGSMARWCLQRFIGGNTDLNLPPGTKEKQHH